MRAYQVKLTIKYFGGTIFRNRYYWVWADNAQEAKQIAEYEILNQPGVSDVFNLQPKWQHTS